MASACERIHIVQRPYERDISGDRGKKRGKINQKRNPVQVHDVTPLPFRIESRRLEQLGLREQFDTRGTADEMLFVLTNNFAAANSRATFGEKATRLRRYFELGRSDRRIGRVPVEIRFVKQSTIDALEAHFQMVPNRRGSGSPVRKRAELIDDHR